ncbi:MAG: VanW family protein, partial [Nocardioidaceae bacterium]
EPVSQFTTYFPHSDYRNTNLGRAAELISGTVLRPGETFSLNDVVGERTAENGFTKGYVISDGALVEDFGGGVSQVATTTYNAAFFAGMKDIEHHPHSFYIDRYPMGREATVAWGALDLQFQNTTPYGVMVQAWIEPSSPSAEGEMHVRMWSTEYWDIEAGLSEQYDFTDAEVRYDTSDSCVEQIGYGGFEVDVYRYFNRNGERVDSETDHVIYNPAPTVHCRPAPKEASSDSQDGGNGGGGG